MASKDVALNIIADIASYQKGMAKIPGVTQKQAASAALRMQRELSKGQKKAAASASKAAEQSSQAWKTAGAQISQTFDTTIAVRNEVPLLRIVIKRS